jgi:hypothetical protein
LVTAPKLLVSRRRKNPEKERFIYKNAVDAFKQRRDQYQLKEVEENDKLEKIFEEDNNFYFEREI